MNKVEWRSYYREQRVLRNEAWRDIPWYEWLYKASTLGRIKSFKDRWVIRECILSSHKNQWWYECVRLHKWWNSKLYLLHRLIAQTFLDNHENKSQVNHKNWIRYDNRLENLEWNTPSENNKHSFKFLWRVTYSAWRRWSDSVRAIQVIQLMKDNTYIKQWGSIIEVRRELWISMYGIISCCKGRQKTSWWFKWKYVSVSK